MSKPILVETSARHIHLSKEDLESLFGKGYELTHRSDLSQPGQFSSEERVTIVGPRKSIENVIVLGPTRPDTQVELSATDARSIGIAAPIRESGHIADTPGCKLVGPKGEVELEKGVIVAKRHIHMTPADAKEYDVTDQEIVCVKIGSDERSLTFDDVVVRVNENFSLAMHIDTDESNAATNFHGNCGIIIKQK